MKKIISIKNLIFILLFLINLFLIVGLIFIAKKVIFVQAELNKLNAKTEEMRFSKNKIRSFKKEEYEKEKAKVKKLVGDQGVPIEAIKEIAVLARGIGLNDVQISVIEDSQDVLGLMKDVSTLGLEVEFNAEYRKIVKFLEEIKSLSYLVNPSKVMIERDSSKLPNLQAKVKLDVFSAYVKQKKAKKNDSVLEFDINQP
jgi:hypothetical protein